MADSRPSAGTPRRPGSIVAPALCLAALLAAAAAPAAAAETPRVRKLLERADESYQGYDYKRAAELYAKADRAADGSSLPAVVGVTRASLYLLRYEDAVEGAERWIGLARTPEARAAGYHHLGLALYWRGQSERWASAPRASRIQTSGPPDLEAGPAAGDGSLRAAADAFRRADEALGAEGEGRDVVLLSLAETLSWLGQREEARAALDAYAAAGGADPYAQEIRCYVGRGDQPEGQVRGDAEAPSPPPDPAEVQWPVKLYAPAPQYPPVARAARMEGAIVLQAIVTKEGVVECIRPLTGHPVPLAYAAMSAVRKWRFEPARLNGEPVDVYYNLTVNFSLGK